MGKAQLCVVKGQYEKALSSLQQMKLECVDREYWRRTMMSRCLYELSMAEDTYLATLQSNLSAFEQFIRRHKEVFEDKQKAHLNFIKVLNLLLNQTKLQPLNEEINRILKKERIVCKLWLLNKCNIEKQ